MHKTDKIVKFLAYDGKISIICANTTELVEEARKIHNLSPVVAVAFGRLLTMAAIMGTEMKNEKDKLTIQIKGNGPIEMMVANANNFPKVKGYVANAQVDIPLNELGNLDVGKAVGMEGYINVIKDIGLKDPYIGISPLTSGEIADDFANYFVKSEQRNSAVSLGVLVNKEGIKSSGGYLINPMPDATEEEISKVEQGIFQAGSMSRMLEQELSLKEIAQRITLDENVQTIEENITPIYQCNCSKENMMKAISAIGAEEIKRIMEEDRKCRNSMSFLQ